jgi:hypothetical protein
MRGDAALSAAAGRSAGAASRLDTFPLEPRGAPSRKMVRFLLLCRYVSCSPFRIPIARLAAAQAALGRKAASTA